MGRMTGSSVADRADARPQASLAWGAGGLLLVAIVTAAAIWWALPGLYPEVPLADGQPLELPGETFSAPIGQDASRGRQMTRIRALQRGQAMFLRRVSLQAAEAPLLRLALTGGHPDLETRLIWRTSQAPNELRSLRLARGDEAVSWHRLAGRDDWAGEIIEIGVLLRGVESLAQAIEPVSLDSIAFQPASRARLARLLWQDWRVFRPWRQSATNFYRGFPRDARVSPVLTTGAWALGALLLLTVVAGLQNRRLPSILPGAVLAVFIPWLALDGLWQHRLGNQLEATRDRFGGLVQAEKRTREDDAHLRSQAREVLNALAPLRGKRLFLLHETESGHNYGRLRMQYHLLPLNVYNFGSKLPQPVHLRTGDHVLLLTDPPAVRFDAAQGVLQDDRVSLPAQRVLVTADIALYRVDTPSP